MKYLTLISLTSIRLSKASPSPHRFSLQTLIYTMSRSGEENLSTFSSTSDADVSTVVPPIEAPPPVVVVESPEKLDEDVEFGFKRAEMYKEKFPGKVTPYDRHVFLCYKTAESWPGKVEGGYDPLPTKLAQTIWKRKQEMLGQTRFAVIEGTGDNTFSDGDVLIFPEMIKYKSVTHDDVDNFVEDVLIKGTIWTNGTSEKLNGYHVFVCCHNSRDRRCGVCGPALVDKLNKEIESLGLKDQVFVSPCSHVGGHKYAGNLIIFGPNSNGTVMGHWYGYVTPDDVPVLLDQHIGKGQIVERLWRGEVCNFKEENKQIEEQKLQENGSVSHLERREKEALQGSNTNGSVQNGGGCCQGTNGFSCCQVQSDSGVEGKKAREGSGICTKGLDRMKAWMGKWDQSDVLAAGAVVGGVATIAVAYSFYRRSG